MLPGPGIDAPCAPYVGLRFLFAAWPVLQSPQAFQGESVAEVVEHESFQLLGDRYARIAHGEWRFLDNLTC